jgi:predicted nucleic acid-binding protein
MPVVDASVVVDLVAPDVGGDAPARVLFGKWAAQGTEPAAPSLLWLETSNALLTGIRRGRWSGADADAAQARLERIPLQRSDIASDLARAFELARRYHNWPVYDMVYVALAERLGTQLITADQRLRERLAHLGWVRSTGEA